MRFPGKFPGSAPGSVWEAASRRRLGARFPGRCPASRQRLSAPRQISREIGHARRENRRFWFSPIPFRAFFSLAWSNFGSEFQLFLLCLVRFSSDLGAFLVRFWCVSGAWCVCGAFGVRLCVSGNAPKTHQIFGSDRVRFWIGI